MLGKIYRLRNNCEDKFLYPLTVSKAVYVNPAQNLQSKLTEIDEKFNDFTMEDIKSIDFHEDGERNFLIKGQGAWKVVPDVTNSYLLELERWQVSNKGEDATHTSLKINEALKWAKENGYDEFVLPKGTYLIDENNPVIVPSRMTFNLGGSKLRIRDNGLERYSVIFIENKSDYIRITNGEIEGDRYTHDYDTTKGTHEWGMGITIKHHCRFIQIDFIHAFNLTGDCVYTEAIPNFYSMSAFDHWEQGSFNSNDGSLAENLNRIRSRDYITLPDAAINEYGFFNVCGNSWGDFGRDIESETFDVYFYNESNDFVDRTMKVKVFDDIEIPNGAKKVKLSYYQAALPDDNEGTALSLCVSLCPRYIYIEKCDFHHARRCGIVPTGKHLYISENKVHHIRGASPGCVIDVEDGYGLNQNIRIFNNHLSESRIGVAFVSTQHVYFYGNYMDRLGQSTVWNECRQVHITSNIMNSCSWDLQGEVLCQGNNLFHSSITSRKSGRHLVANNNFYNSSLKVDKDASFTTLISSNYFHRDLKNIATDDDINDLQTHGSPQYILNNHLDTARLYNYSNQNNWLFTNNLFKLIPAVLGTTIGPGIYDGCVFDCSDLDSSLIFRVSGNDYRYEFNNCTFKQANFFASYNQPMDLLRFDRCDITSTKNNFFYFRDMNGVIEVTNNRFNMSSPTGGTVLSLLASSFNSCEKIIVSGNTFESKGAAMEAMTLSQYPISTLRFTNNTLENTTLTPSNVNLSLYGNIIDGVKDPYYIYNMEPTSGYFKYKQKVEKEIIQPGDYLGWVCIREGTANNIMWRPSTVYKVGDRVNANEKVYEAIRGGTTSSAAPSHSSGNVSDGGVIWSYVSGLAVFKKYGKIEE